MTEKYWLWTLLIGSNIILFFASPWSKSTADFFKGSSNNKTPNTLLLTSSLVICWLFAKSLTNAADLGFEFGIVGGVAYSIYYFSFLVAGVVIYKLRTQGHFQSIHHFISSKYGKNAIRIFSVLIAFRLINEVWSNTMIIGSYFGNWGGFDYNAAVIVFTLLTLAYTLKGGMQTSIVTDLIQMVLFVLILGLVLFLILPQQQGGISQMARTGEWSFSTGLNLFFVALIQIFSYPFHDPVMTDRGFITDPKTMLKSFSWATAIGILSIILFSLVGVFALNQHLQSPAIYAVSKLFGLPMLLLMNVIMLTSAASTVDSTFTSASKLIHVDILKESTLNISKARITMVLVAIIGTIPVFFQPAILSATTLSGTMVLGLAPIFIFWKTPAPKLSFYLSVFTGIAAGIWLSLIPVPAFLLVTTGKHADLLSINIIGSILCVFLFFVPVLYQKYLGNKH